MADLQTGAAATIGLNTRLVRQYTTDFREVDWLKRLHDRASNPYWLVAHLGLTRAYYLQTLGGSFDVPEEVQQFGRGSNCPDRITVTTDELLDLFDQVGRRLAEHMPTLGPDRLDEDCGLDLPNGGRTLGHFIPFMLWHECYHVGQLGLINKALGGAGVGR